MYQDKSRRKRPGGKGPGRQVHTMPLFPELTDLEIQQAAAGIL
jgi:hypothetical protein